MKSLTPGRVARRLTRIFDAEALARYRHRPVQPDDVLYEAFSGSGILDNPEALFRELLDAPDLARLQHVWVLDREARKAGAGAEFLNHPRVRFVTRGSFAYRRAVSTSGWLINNATFPHWFSKRPGQTYLNTWHGTPLKRMGYDMPDGAREAGNTLRNFVASDYLLAQNAFMTDRMYRSAYKLQGHFSGTVIETGYPRVERQELDVAGRAAAVASLAAAGVEIGSKRVVLYAPTWRGDRFADPSDDVDLLAGRVRELQAALGDDYVVLLKTHQVLERFVRARTELRSLLVPGLLPTNVVLGLVDTLVTDYSSIFFDFLATGRRLVFFAPDADAYGTSRGLYFGADELPGPVCSTVAELASLVLAPAGDERLREGQRAEWQSRFATQEPGATARIVDVVFRGRRDAAPTHDLSERTRTSVLVHVGNLASNGITSAALNLLHALPGDRFDVSIAYTRTRASQQLDNSIAIPIGVRQFPREGGMNGTKWQHLRRRVLWRFDAPHAHRDDPRQRELWDDEWVRCFGDARFDAIVDFSGYSHFWTTLLLHSPDTSPAGRVPRSIWLHNDMVAEVGRRVQWRRPLAKSLPAIFALYPDYDARVAVSPALAEINRVSLARVLGRELPIDSAVNLLNPERALALAELPPFEGEPADDGVPAWVAELERDDDTVWFVTVGRYTREKNQERLLRAFARVHAADPRTRLLVVGHGPLASELRETVDALGLTGIATITGALRNPFSVMRSADCFVLSSDYEGQPMVLLEAALLGMPIVSSEFASIADALPAGSMRITAATDDALAEGLAEFLRGEVPPARMDVDAYNAQALGRFEAAVGLARMTRPGGSTGPESGRAAQGAPGGIGVAR